MSNKADCRTALATPGLLIIETLIEQNSIISTEVDSFIHIVQQCFVLKCSVSGIKVV